MIISIQMLNIFKGHAENKVKFRSMSIVDTPIIFSVVLNSI